MRDSVVGMSGLKRLVALFERFASNYGWRLAESALKNKNVQRIRVTKGACVAAMALSGAAGIMSGGAAAQIEQSRIDNNAFALGTLTPATGALSRELWQGADRNAVEDLLIGVPSTYGDQLPLELLRRVTLSPGDGPRGADNALAGRKFLTAAKAGFYQDAASLAELVPSLRTEPTLSQVVAYADLMNGQTDTACARGAGLRDGRTDAFWVKLRFICYVRTGETSAADLTLGLLDRQDALTSRERAHFTQFAAGRTPTIDVAQSVFDWVMLRERGVTMTPELVNAVPLGIAASVARDTGQPVAAREAALVRAISARAIGPSEARSLLDAMPTAGLREALLSVTIQTPGSLEQYEALATALDSVATDWDGFRARSFLLLPQINSAEPVSGYAPRADIVAMAGMVTGQSNIVEKWLLALAQDASDPTSSARTGDLLNLYTALDPGSARRIGSYLGVTLTDDSVAAFTPAATGSGGDTVPLARFVRAGLHAAEAGSEGPASLVFLMGLQGSDDDPSGVRGEISRWARDRADLEWLDRQAAFRSGAQAYLSGAGLGAAGRIVDGRPVPRVKPAGN